MLAKRIKNWIPNLNLPEDGVLAPESRAVEYARSFTLFCLHEAILKNGQDLKNNQWIIEPLANMAISLAIMDTGYKRYMQIEKGEHKNQTRDILQLSIADQFLESHKNGMEIINELFSGEQLKEKLELIGKWYKQMDYDQSHIKYQKKIAKTLYGYKKYYLD